MIYPRMDIPDRQHQSVVTPFGEEEKTVNRNLQQCYTFAVEGDNDTVCYAIQRYVHVYEEGDKTKLFDPTLPGPEKAAGSKETKKNKWRKSKAIALRVRDGWHSANGGRRDNAA